MKKFRKVWAKTQITKKVTISPITDGDLKKTTSVTITKTEVIKKR